MTGGIGLYYRLGPRQPIRDGRRWRRDEQGRTALEAFGALPLAAMYGRLRDGYAAWQALSIETRAAIVAADPEREPTRWLEALRELVSFVKTFGPLGLDWARTFPVLNRAGDQALDQLATKRMTEAMRSLGGSDTNMPVIRTPRLWNVVFPSPGFSGANVREVYSYPEESWNERVRLGDRMLNQDFLGAEPTGPLWNHQDDLRRVLRLVNVLAEADPSPFAIRDAAGALPGIGEYDVRNYGAREPIDVRWNEAMRVVRDTGGRRWAPFEEHSTWVDWPALGRLMLADYLSAQLAWTTVGAGIDGRGKIRTRWTPHSLMEVIYLQLLEHVEERLEFGVGWCANCGGPILRTRLKEQTQNRAHHGCAALLRKRRERARKRVAATAAASTA
jgi:hypothetical protein